MIDKTAQAPIHELLASRWSPRAFTARPPSAEQLRSLLEAARWTPSCFNAQPWRFIVGDTPDKRERIAACILGGNQAWALRAGLLMVACAHTHFEHNGQPNAWAAYDTGAAMMSLSLQATAMGLYVHQMGGFDKDKVRELFALPETIEPCAAAAIGHRGEDLTHLPEWAAEREHAPRERKPLSELQLG